MNAYEREPDETRDLNPTASEASYKPKQRSYRKTNLKKKILAPYGPGAKMSSAETAALKRNRPSFPLVGLVLLGESSISLEEPTISFQETSISLIARVYFFTIMM